MREFGLAQRMAIAKALRGYMEENKVSSMRGLYSAANNEMSMNTIGSLLSTKYRKLAAVTITNLERMLGKPMDELTKGAGTEQHKVAARPAARKAAKKKRRQKRAAPQAPVTAAAAPDFHFFLSGVEIIIPSGLRVTILDANAIKIE